MFDICVIGHITKEIIRIRDKVETEMPGGTAYYTSMAIRALGLNVAVVTKMSGEHRDRLLFDLERAGIAVFCEKTGQTTTFENIYSGRNLDSRVQRVNAISSSFGRRDLGDISATIFHVGPLTNMDVSVEVLREASSRGELVSLDIQGFLRKVENAEVMETDWSDKEKGLACIDILKADRREAAILSGESEPQKAACMLSRFGPQEVIITDGGRGSLIHADGELHRIPAFHPRKIVDPTGCGDTFMAGYIYQRLRTRDLRKAGRFAAFIASLKLEKFGALKNVRQLEHL
jgi:sugar/nucleoside kinase (ribokinase family)